MDFKPIYKAKSAADNTIESICTLSNQLKKRVIFTYKRSHILAKFSTSKKINISKEPGK